MDHNQSDLLKIGDFSQLSQVTIKTLRHYDSIGLLQPAYIDPSNGYRYYSIDQLPQIHRIMALKGIGLSLGQIASLVGEDLPSDQIRGMLRLRQSEIEEKVQTARRQMAIVEFHLRMIEAEENFPVLDVVLKPLERMHILSLFIAPASEANHPNRSMGQLVEAIYKAIDNGIIHYTGVSYDVFHGETLIPFESKKLAKQQHEILLGVDRTQEPVTLEGFGHFTVREEPAIKTAATLMVTDADMPSNMEKVTLMRRWAIANGYQPRGLVRYLHYRGPMQTLNKDDFLFEAQMPLQD